MIRYRLRPVVRYSGSTDTDCHDLCDGSAPACRCVRIVPAQAHRAPDPSSGCANFANVPNVAAQGLSLRHERPEKTRTKAATCRRSEQAGAVTSACSDQYLCRLYSCRILFGKRGQRNRHALQLLGGQQESQDILELGHLRTR